MDNLKNIANQETIRDIQNDSLFKQKCVHEFFFLINNYGFNKIRTENYGKGSVLVFEKKGEKTLSVIVEYEMGTLPSVEVYFKSSVKKIFYEDTDLKKYPVHNKIRQLVQGEIISIDDYIKELDTIWKQNYDNIAYEVGMCLEFLASEVMDFLRRETWLLN
jgi:hypothetical protein